MTRLLCFTMALALAGVAGAEQYWIAYEGNDWPENEGWFRIWGDDQAYRWIEDGALVIDSLHDTHIADFYRWNVDGPMDPEPGETFMLEWRLRVDQVIDVEDPGLGVRSAENWAVSFTFREDGMRSVFENDVIVPFEPGVFHDFELYSSDMRTYELYIDDELAREGWFSRVSSGSRVAWGDVIQGQASLSRWDYVRFGVVPEPTTCLPYVMVTFGVILRRRRADRYGHTATIGISHEEQE